MVVDVVRHGDGSVIDVLVDDHLVVAGGVLHGNFELKRLLQSDAFPTLTPEQRTVVSHEESDGWPTDFNNFGELRICPATRLILTDPAMQSGLEYKIPPRGELTCAFQRYLVGTGFLQEADNPNTPIAYTHINSRDGTVSALLFAPASRVALFWWSSDGSRMEPCSSIGKALTELWDRGTDWTRCSDCAVWWETADQGPVPASADDITRLRLGGFRGLGGRAPQAHRLRDNSKIRWSPRFWVWYYADDGDDDLAVVCNRIKSPPIDDYRKVAPPIGCPWLLAPAGEYHIPERLVLVTTNDARQANDEVSTTSFPVDCSSDEVVVLDRAVESVIHVNGYPFVYRPGTQKAIIDGREFTIRNESPTQFVIERVAPLLVPPQHVACRYKYAIVTVAANGAAELYAVGHTLVDTRPM